MSSEEARSSTSGNCSARDSDLTTSSDVSGSSCANNAVGSRTRRPSYFDFLSTSGLRPSRNQFDMGVIKRLDDTGGFDLLEDSCLSSQDEEKLKTFLRIRPIGSAASGTTTSKASNVCVAQKDDTTVTAYTSSKQDLFQNPIRKKTEFKFTKVLGPECGQATVYEECVAPLVNKFMKHENCLVFSYGATNSGKTYTMQGYGNDYGIIPRTLEAIFSRISQRQYKLDNIRPRMYKAFNHLTPQCVEILREKRERIVAEANRKNDQMNIHLNNSAFSSKSGSPVNLAPGINGQFDLATMWLNSTLYSVWVSFAELYNERVYDLLDNSIGKNKRRKELKLLQDRDGFVYIKDLSEFPVSSDEEAFKLFLAGRKNLRFAATHLNQTSSRSHSFFMLRVVTVGIGNGELPFPKTVHRMTFCDLAGMERAGQTENKGGRLMESGNINNSLIVLLRVIRTLREKQMQNGNLIETVPFRESKLTHIFKSYLTSSTHICMLVNVSPDPSLAQATYQVLQNSAIASNVIVFRPVEVNVEAQPLEAHKQPLKCLNQNKVMPPQTKPTRKQKQALKTKKGKAKEKSPILQARESRSGSSDEGGDENQVTTMIAPKMMIDKVKALENEVADLKMRLQKSEEEKMQLEIDMMKMLNEERLQWRNRLQEALTNARNFNFRRISLLKRQLSPGSRCSRYSSPVENMEDIDEIHEDDNEEDEKNDSDKENSSKLVLSSCNK